MNIVVRVSVILAILCMGYGVVIGIHVGRKATFLKFWFGSGIGFALLSYLLNYFVKEQIHLPKTLVVVVIVFMTGGICCECFILFQIYRYAHQRPTEPADVIIVLGAKIERHKITKSLKNRLDGAVSYANSNKLQIPIIVSGGQGDDEIISEAGAMKQYLLEQGIPNEQILCEDASTDTRQNILYSKKIIEQLPFQNQPIVYIASNDFHLYRGIKLARKQGIKAYGLPSKADPVLSFSYYVRESLAVVKDILYGNMNI